MAVMEQNQSGMSQRVVVTDTEDTVTLKSRQSLEEEKKDGADEQTELNDLRSQWARQFLSDGGITFTVEKLLTLNISEEATRSIAELKDISFFVTLSKVFITAALSATTNNVSSAMTLVRKQSSIQDDDLDDVDMKEETKDSSDIFQEIMKEGTTSQEIILNTDFDSLVNKLLELSSALIVSLNFSIEHKVIVENALSLIVGAILNRPELLQHLVEFKSKTTPQIESGKDFIIQGLLICTEDKIRQDFKNSLNALCQNLFKDDQNALAFVLNSLANNFSEISNRPCAEFFDLFNTLIDQQSRRDDLARDLGGEGELQAFFDPEDLLNQIIARFKVSQQQVGLQGDQDDDNDGNLDDQAEEKEKLMIGLIQLTRKIIARADSQVTDRVIVEQDLISQIFKEFLFASYFAALDASNLDIKLTQKSRKSKKSGKKKAEKSRQEAFSLLIQLIQNSSFLMNRFLDQNLLPLIKTIKTPKGWLYVPPGTSNFERSQEYVGLKNLGCICYMNSMMQQFFMVPNFRYNLLCVDDGKEEELKEYRNEVIDDNMFH